MSIRGTLPSGGAGGGGAVTTVAGRTGDVVIAESDVTNLTTDLAAKASALVASQSISSTATLVDGSAKMVLTDTTAAAFTLTLPASPSSGSIFIILDSLGTWNTNNLTVARNGKLIDGVAANATHVTQYGIVEYLYDGTGWRSKIRQLSQANPVINGTAAPGTSLKVSREDHVHPTDTSRAPASGIAISALSQAASERAFIIGKAGAIAATETDAADFFFIAPFNGTFLRMKSVVKTAVTGAAAIQLRAATAPTNSITWGNVSGFVTTFTGSGYFVATVDPANVNFGEGDLVGFSVSTGSGSDLLVEVVVVPR